MDKDRDYFLLLSELKQKQWYSFSEKQLSSLLKTNDDELIKKILNHNIQYFSNELKAVEALILSEQESEEKKNSSVSSGISEYSESDVSNWNLK